VSPSTVKDTEGVKPCPRCGKPVPPAAPLGLCLACFRTTTGLPGEAYDQPAPTAQPQPTQPLPNRPGEPARTAAFELKPGLGLNHDRYRLIRLLGRGGMGEVWLAEDQQLLEGDAPTMVALKFLAPAIRDHARALEALRSEVLKGRQLKHPNIVSIFDWSQWPGEPGFVSMEFVDGRTLDELLARRPKGFFQWADLKPLAKQVCDAVRYAHHSEQRLIHCDIKPRNVMVTGLDIKLSDFGIARPLATARRMGVRLRGGGGTPAYMSPQQARGEEPTIADDVYSLGATLYELLTGEPPLFNDAPGGGVRLVSMEEQWKARGHSDVPPDVRATIERCLEPDPSRRPRTVFELAVQLGLEGSPHPPPRSTSLGALPTVPPPEIRRPRGSVRAVVGLLLVLGLGTVTFLNWPRLKVLVTLLVTPPAPPGPQPAPPAPTVVVTPASAAVAEGNLVLSGLTTNVAAFLTVTNAPPPSTPPTTTPTTASTATPSSPSKPTIRSPPESDTVEEGRPFSFTVVATGAEPLRYQWYLNDQPMRGEAGATLQFASVKRSQAGQYRVEVSNPGGSVRSAPATLTVAPPSALFPAVGQRWTNSLGMEFIPLPLPNRKVWMSRWETRVRDFEEQPQLRNYHRSLQSRYPFPITTNHPILAVSWNQATAFCTWLTDREREQAKGPALRPSQSYRLPRVDEWFKALGSATNLADLRSRGFVYWWGGPRRTPPDNAANFAGQELYEANNSYEHIQGFRDRSAWPAKVGSFGEDRNGFCDLAGNVWEMCDGGPRGMIKLGGAWDTAEPRELATSEGKLIRSAFESGPDTGFRCVVVEEP
jgi:serine/threonine protein kinase